MNRTKPFFIKPRNHPKNPCRSAANLQITICSRNIYVTPFNVFASSVQFSAFLETKYRNQCFHNNRIWWCTLKCTFLFVTDVRVDLWFSPCTHVWTLLSSYRSWSCYVFCSVFCSTQRKQAYLLNEMFCHAPLLTLRTEAVVLCRKFVITMFAPVWWLMGNPNVYWHHAISRISEDLKNMWQIFTVRWSLFVWFLWKSMKMDHIFRDESRSHAQSEKKNTEKVIQKSELSPMCVTLIWKMKKTIFICGVIGSVQIWFCKIIRFVIEARVVPCVCLLGNADLVVCAYILNFCINSTIIRLPREFMSPCAPNPGSVMITTFCLFEDMLMRARTLPPHIINATARYASINIHMHMHELAQRTHRCTECRKPITASGGGNTTRHNIITI